MATIQQILAEKSSGGQHASKVKGSLLSTRKAIATQVNDLKRLLRKEGQAANLARTLGAGGLTLLTGLLTGGTSIPIMAAAAGLGGLGGQAIRGTQKKMANIREDLEGSFLKGAAPSEDELTEQMFSSAGTDALMQAITMGIPIGDLLKGAVGGALGKIPLGASIQKGLQDKVLDPIKSKILESALGEGVGSFAKKYTLGKRLTPGLRQLSFSSMSDPYSYDTNKGYKTGGLY